MAQLDRKDRKGYRDPQALTVLMAQLDRRVRTDGADGAGLQGPAGADGADGAVGPARSTRH